MKDGVWIERENVNQIRESMRNQEVNYKKSERADDHLPELNDLEEAG